MKLFASIALTVALAAGVAPAMAATPSEPTLTVTGTGSVDRNPDQVAVAFTIVTNDPDASRATSANNAIYAAVLGRMRALGLAESAIRTTSYDLNYVPHPPKAEIEPRGRYGYVVSRGVTATSDRTDQAGALIDAAVAAGVSDVGGVTFGIRDQRAAYRAALAAAVTDADAQAQALAEAAHVRVLGIARIAPGPSGFPPREPLAMARTQAGAFVPTEIQPGNLTVQALVTIAYRIAP